MCLGAETPGGIFVSYWSQGLSWLNRAGPSCRSLVLQPKPLLSHNGANVPVDMCRKWQDLFGFLRWARRKYASALQISVWDHRSWIVGSLSWEPFSRAASYVATQELHGTRRFSTVPLIWARSDNFNIILSATSWTSLWSFPFWLSYQYPICIDVISDSCYISRPFDPPWFDHSKYSWRWVQVMNLFVVQFSPTPTNSETLCDILYGKEFVTPRTTPQAGWAPLVRRPSLRRQPEDARCRGDRDPIWHGHMLHSWVEFCSCYRLSRPHGHSADRRVMSVETFKWHGSLVHAACSIVPRLTALQRALYPEKFRMSF
jgi:hypothetical protein